MITIGKTQDTAGKTQETHRTTTGQHKKNIVKTQEWETCSKVRYPKTIKMDPNRVEVGPCGPKLCQNVGPRLRIIFQALLDPKVELKTSKNPKIIKIHIPVKSGSLDSRTRCAI